MIHRVYSWYEYRMLDAVAATSDLPWSLVDICPGRKAYSVNCELDGKVSRVVMEQFNSDTHLHNAYVAITAADNKSLFEILADLKADISPAITYNHQLTANCRRVVFH